MSRTITVLGETEVVNGGTRRRFYIVSGSSWTNLDSNVKHPDLATVAKNRFEDDIRKGATLVIANLETEVAMSITFDRSLGMMGDYVLTPMDFNEVDY